ncbi:uncharacterized protein DFL_001075 [Arthrobotrys flagrans]|uniref:Uncharacterized protein n=1 Tax=Arthrobotrys flagrans TaxID=97331 RepID=A0A437AG56_ARTFL|nr:hypothetical protein DFL_001075 [Arthrobotrys flagrans]
MMSFSSWLQVFSYIWSAYHSSVLLLFTFIKSTYSSPVVLKQPSRLFESKAMMFRVAAYTDIMNHVLKSKMAMNASDATTAAATDPALQEMSLSQKSAKVAAIIGLVIALIAVVAIASLVTASTLSVLAFNK